MSHFMGVGIFRIGLNRTDLGCWRLTLSFRSHLFNKRCRRDKKIYDSLNQSSQTNKKSTADLPKI